MDIALSDFWELYYAIGIDTDKQKLFYVRKHEGVNQQIVIDLLKVSSCNVNKIARDTNGIKVIDRIELAFSYRDPNYTVKALEFYSRDQNLILGHELKICERWCTVINSSLAEAVSRTPVLS